MPATGLPEADPRPDGLTISTPRAKEEAECPPFELGFDQVRVEDLRTLRSKTLFLLQISPRRKVIPPLLGGMIRTLKSQPLTNKHYALKCYHENTFDSDF